jgi:hypothetical protein
LRHAASESYDSPPSDAEVDGEVFLLLCGAVATACTALGAVFPLERLEAESVEYEALEYPPLDADEALEDAARRGGAPTGAEELVVGGAADAAAFVGRAERRDEADDAYDDELRELEESEL